MYKTGNGVYWETLPPQNLDVDGNPIPYPVNWKVLPANLATSLGSLFTLAKTDIESDYGI